MPDLSAAIQTQGIKEYAVKSIWLLTLSLFMFRILADDPDYAFALNDFALFAHRLYGCSYLHAALSFLQA